MPRKCKDRGEREVRAPRECPERTRAAERTGAGRGSFPREREKTTVLRCLSHASSGKVPPSLVLDHKKNFCIGQQLF